MPFIRDPLVEQVIACAIEVHRNLGPGLLEAVCQRCLCYELGASGIAFLADQAVPINYKGLELHCGHRLDMIVENRLILELKSVDHLLPVHKAQLLTYLRLLGVRQGLLINFNVPRLTDGIKSALLTKEQHEDG